MDFNNKITRQGEMSQIDFAQMGLRVHKDCFADYELKDIEKTIQSQLLDLVKNECIHSSMRLIPLVDEEGVTVCIGLFHDQEAARKTFRCTTDDPDCASFISVHDVVNAIEEIGQEYNDSYMKHELHYIFSKLAYRLGIDPNILEFNK